MCIRDRYAAARGYRTEVVGLNETELGGCKEISFLVSGSGAYSRLKYESGVHRVYGAHNAYKNDKQLTSGVIVFIINQKGQ